MLRGKDRLILPVKQRGVIPLREYLRGGLGGILGLRGLVALHAGAQLTFAHVHGDQRGDDNHRVDAVEYGRMDLAAFAAARLGRNALRFGSRLFCGFGRSLFGVLHTRASSH